MFWTLGERAVAMASGDVALDPAHDMPLPVYVTPEGLDLQQLVQKFMLMSVTFSQAMDDYLDSGTEGKGLDASNERTQEDPYSGLEHAWDEGFGYFGAARDYGEYTDEEIAGAGGREGWSEGYHDTDGDGAIDLMAEYNFGASINAAKRDLGSSEGAKTDFTKQAFDAFLRGRTIIHNAGDTLTSEEMSALEQERDQVAAAWEGAIAATVVHYINDVLAIQHAASMDESAYVFTEHAKAWSEIKGFSLGFQFNPRSPMNEQNRFTRFHELVGDAPVLPSDGDQAISDYATRLLEARAILQQAYGFDDANMGDEHGANGW